jgi:hypothetical protein
LGSIKRLSASPKQVPNGIKNKSQVKNITFLGNNEFSLGKKLKFFKEKCFFSSENMIVPQEKKSFKLLLGAT